MSLSPVGRDPELDRLVAANLPRGASVWTPSLVVGSQPPVVVVHFSNMGSADQASTWQRAAVVERDRAGRLTWSVIKGVWPHRAEDADAGYLDGAYGLPSKPALIFVRFRRGTCEVTHAVDTTWGGWRANPWAIPSPEAPARDGSALPTPAPQPPPRPAASPRPSPATRERPITLTVPGWIGWEAVGTHALSAAGVVALPMGEDYLSRPFSQAIAGREDVEGFRWSGAIGDTLSHSHLLGPDPSAAAADLTSRILGMMAEAYIRAQRSHAIVPLNIEAHSWGGVLAYLALRTLETSEPFRRYSRGGVQVNLDTMGSPVGCLDRDTLDRQIGRTKQGLLTAGANLVDVPDEAVFLTAFARAGLKLQTVSLGRSVTWRNYRIEEDFLACDVASLPLDRKYVLPFTKDAGKAHSQYYSVAANAAQIVETRRPKVALLPLSGEK